MYLCWRNFSYVLAPYKQVSRQNTGIQRTQTPTIQPTATVRPQPQNLQASPSTLVAHRGPPPLPSSSNRITFNSQGPMVHTQAQPHGRYVVNQVTGDLRGLPPYRVPQMREVRSTSPYYPPPSYSVANARLRTQVKTALVWDKQTP